MAWALVWLAMLAAPSTSPFLETAGLRQSDLRKLDGIVLADGARGEGRILGLFAEGSGYRLDFLRGHKRIRVPLSKLRTAYLCDGTRIEADPSVKDAYALDRAGKTHPWALQSMSRLDDTFIVTLHGAGKNHAYVYLEIGVPGFRILPGSNRIVEGWGWKRFHLGMTGPEIERLLGNPESGSTAQWLVYKRSWKIHFFLGKSGGGNKVTEIRFERGCKERLFRSSIGHDGTRADVFRFYGAPIRTERVKEAGYEAGVLYEVGSAAKIIYAEEGVLFWFHRDEVAQIVIVGKSAPRPHAPAAP